MAETTCALCKGEPDSYCPCDGAFLCFSCDAVVHKANFLAASHVRSKVCRYCRKISDHHKIYDIGVSSPTKITCRNCSPEVFPSHDADSLSTSSSSCVSSTTEIGDELVSNKRETFISPPAIVRREKVPAPSMIDLENVLVKWCRKLEFEKRKINVQQVVNTAMEMLNRCLDKMTILPLRVTLAAALKMALRVSGGRGGDTCQDLRRLQQISGVPLKLLMAAEFRLACTLKRRRSREDHKEGWAEC